MKILKASRLSVLLAFATTAMAAHGFVIQKNVSPDTSQHAFAKQDKQYKDFRRMAVMPLQDNEIVSKNHRRELLKAAPALSWCFVLGYIPRPTSKVMAFTGVNPDDFIFHVKATFPKGFSLHQLDPQAALTITVKPVITYNKEMPAEITTTNIEGKRIVPFVLESRSNKAELLSSTSTATNNREVTITFNGNHLTPEGSNMKWWANKPLILSANLGNLEGCKFLLNRSGVGNFHQITLPLQKRGVCYDLLSSS